MIHPYATTTYAQALSYWGRPLYVPEWGTSVLIREIMPGLEDASGTYPIAILNKQADILGGLERLRSHNLVSVVFVVDDFHRPSLEELNQYFTIVRPFKTHYLYRKSCGILSYNKHHRYELRQALKAVHVSTFDLSHNMEAWTKLYSNLISNKGITGLQSFPSEYHRVLGELDGVTAIGAWHNDELVSCHIWVAHNEHVHSHLAASSAEGYALRAAYAVNDASLHHFLNAEVINIGGGAGFADNANDGLARFKRGFSNDTTLSYICGTVIDSNRYTELVQERGTIECPSFFPAYRAPK